MKFSTLVISLLTLPGVMGGSFAESSLVHFKPLKVPYEALFNEDDSNTPDNAIMKALQEVGMISITQIPRMTDLKKMALSWDLHVCAQESSAAESHHYNDGSHRRTLATHTMDGISPQVEHMSSSAFCRDFDKAATSFRASVNEVTRFFANSLSLKLSKEQDPLETLLTTDSDLTFATFADVVEYGEHLEHFHSYQRMESKETVNQDNQVRTMDLHVDQGLFLVFAPGRMTHQDPTQETSLSTGFIIELKDGTQAMVDFDEEDDLVILLGDGVNQYINPRLPVNQALRAVPHALALPPHTDDEARVWYGRMVLPPASAIHPLHGKTFAELRRDLIRASTASDEKDMNVLSLGCASSAHVARQLEEMSCTADTLMCWHKCMSLAEFNVSEEICASQDKEVFCINPRGELWDGTHGDFFPGCATNDTSIATPYPTLPNYPPDADVCTETSFIEFANSMPYEHQIELSENRALFLWNVTDDHVQGRIVFNGLLGYLSIGLANVGGEKNGMHGANIIMAIPGGNYSAVTGFDLSIEPSVQEFQISPDSEEASFRFWGVEGGTAEARHAELLSDLDLTDCFSSFTFETSSINGIPFNLTGVDQLLWAANDIDSFAGYHGMNRGRFSVDWVAGQSNLDEESETAETTPPESGAANHGMMKIAPLVFLFFASIGMI